MLDGGIGNDYLNGGNDRDTLLGGAGNDEMHGGAGVDVFRLDSFEGIDFIDDFATKGGSKDKLSFVRSLFEDFDGSVAELFSEGYVRAQNAPGNNTQVQVDLDGGGDNFVTVAVLNGTISNGTLASQTVIFEDTPVA